MRNIQYKIGADPELFLIDDKTKKFRSAHDLIPGSKHCPTLVNLGAVQPDGTAAEFNIQPAITAEEFVHNIKVVLSQLQAMVTEKDPDLKLYVTPTAMFDTEYFKTLPYEATDFGCTPDFDAWTGKPRPFKGTDRPMRTGAGHVHVGWTEDLEPMEKPHFYDCREGTKQLDASLFLMSLAWDNDSTRRQLYGTVGSFRPKSYGFEYRPLSNAYIADPDLQAWVFKATVHAMELLDMDGLCLWKDKEAEALLLKAQAGEPIRPSELVRYHDFLVNDQLFEPLPDYYINRLDARAAAA